MGIRSRDNSSDGEEGSLQQALRKAGLGEQKPSPRQEPTEVQGATSPQESRKETPEPVPAPAPEPAKPASTVESVKAAPAQQAAPAPRQQAPAETFVHKGNTMQQKSNTTLASQLSSRIRPISRGTSSQRAGELSRNLQKCIGEGLGDSPLAKGWNVQVMDQTNGLSFPVIMLTFRQSDTEGNTRVATFALLVEPEDHRISPRIEKFDQQSYEVITTLGDIYNSQEFSGVVEAAIRRVQKLDSKDEISHAGGLRVPASLNLTETVINELAFQAVTACFSTMDRYIALFDEAPFTLVNRDMQSEKLIGRLTVNGKHFINELGEPIRADLRAMVDSNRQGGAMMLGDTNISTIMGYCEPVYTQPSSDPSRPKRPFYPMLVITNVIAGADQTDIESLQLSLVNGVQLIQFRNAWADQFRRRLSPLHDVGALGLLTPLGERINTKTDEFKAQFDQFMHEYFELNVGMVVAIDIADVGPMAWAFDILKACANGNTAAIAAWERALDNLTGNAYSAIATQMGIKGRSPVVSQGDRRHAGHYNDPERGLCDIRDVDLLAVANAHGTNPLPVETYVESTVPTKGTDNTRAAERYTTVDDVLQGRQVVTGYYTRLYFAPGALQAAAKACEQAKLMIQPSHIVHGLGSSLRMSGFDYAGLLTTTADSGALLGVGATTGAASTRW